MDDEVLPSMEAMEVLQLILNVIAITAVTSLALMWYLQKRDNRKMRFELNLHSERNPDLQMPLTQSISSTDHDGDPRKEPVRSPGNTELVSPPLSDQDIRQYVARRARGWAARSQ